MTTAQLTVHPKIFISHSWVDKEFVRQLEVELKAPNCPTDSEQNPLVALHPLVKKLSDFILT